MTNSEKWTGGLQSHLFFRHPSDPPNIHPRNCGGSSGKACVTFTATSIEMHVRREKNLLPGEMLERRSELNHAGGITFPDTWHRSTGQSFEHHGWIVCPGR
jgi:hypothetical protein